MKKSGFHSLLRWFWGAYLGCALLFSSCGSPFGKEFYFRVTYQNGQTEVVKLKKVYSGEMTELKNGCTQALLPTMCGLRKIELIK